MSPKSGYKYFFEEQDTYISVQLIACYKIEIGNFRIKGCLFYHCIDKQSYNRKRESNRNCGGYINWLHWLYVSSKCKNYNLEKLDCYVLESNKSISI